MWETILLIDFREVRTQRDRDYIISHLLTEGAKVEQRDLRLGDMMWVMRRVGAPAGEDEFVLDYIVERKRVDDLAQSIMDGRSVC